MSETIEENVTTTEKTVEKGTHEYVIIGEENYKTESVTTGINNISFTLTDMPIADVVEKFSNVEELKISGVDLQPYGIYKNLTFSSVAVDYTGGVTITFHIASAGEIRIATLEQTQAEQDEVIAELIGGV